MSAEVHLLKDDAEDEEEFDGNAHALQGNRIQNDEPELNEHEDDEDDDDKEEEEEDDDDELGEINRYWPPPVKESVELIGSLASKRVSAFTFNNSGTRFAAGGYDHEVRIWDFEALGMQGRQPICNVQPCGQTVIKNLDYTNDDELVLVIPGSCEAVLIAKDGLVDKKHQCPKGDQYLSDMANTKGHVQMLNDGCWNPKDKQSFITCSNDCTVRIWDLNKLDQQKTVIKTRSPGSGLKATPNVCKYSRDALSIVAGCSEGSVMMWDTRRKFISTSACIRNAHFKGSEITGLDFSYGSGKICTRSEDESCKIWDLRKLKDPLATRTSLTNSYSNTDCSFSPDDKLVITGTSCTKQEPGELHFLDASDLTSKEVISVPDTSIVRSKWHPKINHIGYSCTNGSLFVAYERGKSLGGFLSATEWLSRGGGSKKKRKTFESGSSWSSNSNSNSIKKIITPHSLPLFRDDPSSSSFAKIRQDPRRSYKPEIPSMSGTNQGGRVKPAGSTLSSYIAKNIAKPADDGGLDIRERILRHADEAEKEPFWVKPFGVVANDQRPQSSGNYRPMQQPPLENDKPQARTHKPPKRGAQQ